MERSTSPRPPNSVDQTRIYVLRAALLVLAVAAVLIIWRVASVDRSDITSYTVPKQTAVERSDRQRLLGAIIPHERQAWFFKISAPDPYVVRLRDAFRSFIRSVRFVEGVSRPKWTVPDGWRQLPDLAPQNLGALDRVATLQIPSKERFVELAVTALPIPASAPKPSYILSNINRWRSQMQLPPIRLDQLADQTEQVQLDGATATLVELVGTGRGRPMGHPPLASGRFASSRRGAGSAGLSPQLKLEIPPGWEKAKGSSLSIYAFQVDEQDRRIEITVTPLAAAAGALLPNINRWRRQIQLGSLTRQQLDQQIQPIEVDGVPGHYIQLVGPHQTILGAIVVHGDTAWFFKLKGDTALASREQQHFKQFVESVRFGEVQGAKHGN